MISTSAHRLCTRSAHFHYLSGIMAFEFVARTLSSIPVVVWGEEAMAFLGVGTLLNVRLLLLLSD